MKIAATLSAIAFIYTGWLYIPGGINSRKREHAHEIFRNVIIGLFFVFGAWLIVTMILDGLCVVSEFTETIKR